MASGLTATTGRSTGLDRVRTVTGRITLVQESRFRLTTNEGRGKLFLLSHAASIEPQDLAGLQHDQTRVTVRYTDAREMIAGVAHDVAPAGEPRPESDGRAHETGGAG